MRVQLSPDLEAFVRSKIGSGRFRDASDVMNEALSEMRRRDQTEAAQIDRLRAEVLRGDAGEFRELNIRAIVEELDKETPTA